MTAGIVYQKKIGVHNVGLRTVLFKIAKFWDEKKMQANLRERNGPSVQMFHFMKEHQILNSYKATPIPDQMADERRQVGAQRLALPEPL